MTRRGTASACLFESKSGGEEEAEAQSLLDEAFMVREKHSFSLYKSDVLPDRTGEMFHAAAAAAETAGCLLI